MPVVVFAAQGDAHRSMTLLWRTAGSPGVRTGPGPKPALSVDAIVDAAIAVADAEGMAGLSMRAVAQRFGRTAMALYTYVPNKSELVDLMYDRAHAELPDRYDDRAGWRAAATTWAGDLWAFYLRHPWVLQVSQARPVLGPHEFVALETVVTILYPTGLPAGLLQRVVGTLFHFVRGTAQTATESRQAPTATGMSEDEWWYARSALLDQVAPDFADRFPMLTRLGSQGAYTVQDETVGYLEQEARETFQVGLGVLFDGIGAAIARLPTPADPAEPPARVPADPPARVPADPAAPPARVPADPAAPPADTPAGGSDPLATDFPAGVSAPAVRALVAAGYTELRQLAGVPAADLRRLHGMGPKALTRLSAALEQQGMSLR